MKTLIKNGRVITTDFDGFREINLLIEDGRILELTEAGAADNIIDAKGKYVLPGLIDIHTHGSVGATYSSTGILTMRLYTVRVRV